MNSEFKRKFRDELRRLLREHLGSLPEEYTEHYALLLQARQVFQEEMAAALQPSLNRLLSTPRTGIFDDSYEGRRHLAALVNDNLWMLNLAPRDPRGGHPAYLTVKRSDSGKTNRCHIHLRVREGHRRTRASMFEDWPQLELIDDPPKHQHTDRWFTDNQSTRGR